MPNLTIKVGSLDLSSFIRVNPGEHFNPAAGDMVEPSWSDSPLFEGQVLTSMHVKNKEMVIPLFLHPPTAPYTQDPLNYLIQQVNQALRPANDLGLTTYLQMQLAQAANPTFFTIQFGRFEPNFNFRITEKGWFAGDLHLWVLPFGHTATERCIGTYAAPANQSGMVISAAQLIASAYQYGVSPTTIIPSNVPTNLAPDPSFEFPMASSPWVLSLASQYATTVMSDVVSIPDATQAFEYLVRASSADSFFGLASAVNMVPVNPGSQYMISYDVYGGSNAVSALVRSQLQWRDGTGASLILTSQGATHVAGASWVTYTDGPFTAPASAVLCQVNFHAGPIRASQVMYFDEIGLFPGASAPAWGSATPFVQTTPTGFAVLGDAPPQFDLRLTVGNFLGDDGRLGIISALPIASYNPIIPVGSFIGLSPSAIVFGASGAWASQFIALDAAGGSAGAVGGATDGMGYFSFAVSPGSVYAGENRVLGLTRARLEPFGLRAFDQQGNALGPTVIASAIDGWQIIDYGVLRVAPWQATALVSIQAYGCLPFWASGMFAPVRTPPAWTKEHGAIFVVPNDTTIMDLDWNSPLISTDSFDGASGALLGQDQIGNAWATNANFSYLLPIYSGSSGLVGTTVGVASLLGGAMPSAFYGDFEIEAIFTNASGNFVSPDIMHIGVMNPLTGAATTFLAEFALGGQGAAPHLSIWTPAGFQASVAIPSAGIGQYHMKLTKRASLMWANLGGPSGAFSSFASGGLASVGVAVNAGFASSIVPWFTFPYASSAVRMEAFRARQLASQGYQPQDILRLYQPLYQNTRMSPAAVDVVDLQARQRGPIGAISLPVPSLGAGLFVMSMPFDQGTAADTLNADVRVRERFTYAR